VKVSLSNEDGMAKEELLLRREFARASKATDLAPGLGCCLLSLIGPER
jgi:hypothetical protein